MTPDSPRPTPPGDEAEYPRVGTSAGPQVIVSTDAEGAVFEDFADFEAAADRWKERRAAWSGQGFVLWFNDGDLWRYSGITRDEAYALLANRKALEHGRVPEEDR